MEALNGVKFTVVLWIERNILIRQSIGSIVVKYRKVNTLPLLHLNNNV